MFAVSVARSGAHGAGPAAAGAALALGTAAAAAGAASAGVNPALVLGPSVVYACGWPAAWARMAAQVLGGLAAGVAAVAALGGTPATRGGGAMPAESAPPHEPLLGVGRVGGGQEEGAASPATGGAAGWPPAQVPV